MYTHMSIILQNIEDYQNSATSIGLPDALKLVSILRKQLRKVTTTFRGSCEGWPAALEKALDRLNTYSQAIGVESIAVALKEKGTATAKAMVDDLPNISGDLANIKYIFQHQAGLETLMEKEDVPEKPDVSQLVKIFGAAVKTCSVDLDLCQKLFPPLAAKIEAWLGKVQEAMQLFLDSSSVSLADWKNDLAKFRQGPSFGMFEAFLFLLCKFDVDPVIISNCFLMQMA